MYYKYHTGQTKNLSIIIFLLIDFIIYCKKIFLFMKIIMLYSIKVMVVHQDMASVDYLDYQFDHM